MLNEFKEFAAKGNMIDMAVGIIIGGAFGKLVTSIVEDLIMPPIGLLIGGIDFTGLKLMLKKAAGTAPGVSINYGNFIQIGVNFLIVAFAVFMLVKAINALRKQQEAAPAAEPPKQELLLTEIRDLLKNRS
jgi:large conductance mechanosensitive channel